MTLLFVSVALRHIRRIACEQSYAVCDAEAYAHKHEFVYRSSKKGSGNAESFLLKSDFVYSIEAIDSNSSTISLSGAFVARLTMMITMLAQMNAGNNS